MQAFSDATMRRLEQLAQAGEAVSTDQVREHLDLTTQQFHRLTLQEDFPKRLHIGRKFWINPHELWEFAQRWNRLARGVAITELAALIRSTVPTTRRLVRRADFPRPLGELNGRVRWDRDECVAWHRPRVGGAKLPEGADAPATTSRTKKKRALTRGIRNGKT